jgi:uroporphyrinogen-III synthase
VKLVEPFISVDEINKAVLACIGPVTAQTAKELGLSVDIVADRYTIDGLVDAVVSGLEKVRK